MTIPDTPAGDALLSLIWNLYTKKVAEQRAKDHETQSASSEALAVASEPASVAEAPQTSKRQRRHTNPDRVASS